MRLSNLCDYSQSHSFSSLLNLIPPLSSFQAILAVLLSIPSPQWEGCHEQPANSMFLEGGDPHSCFQEQSWVSLLCWLWFWWFPHVKLPGCWRNFGCAAFNFFIIIILSFWLFCKQECIKRRWRMWRSSTIEIKGTKFYQQSQQISDLLKWSQLLYYCLLLHYAQ